MQFTIANEMSRHWKQVHLEERPHQSNQCNKTFKMKGTLPKNVFSIHDKVRLYCVLYDQYFAKSSFKKHISSVHMN